MLQEFIIFLHYGYVGYENNIILMPNSLEKLVGWLE
jgi:hypothetical protein